LLCPTASQKPVPAHETARRRLPVPVVAGGVVTSVHAVPFHISLKGTAVGVVSVAPTARHQVALTQFIPVARTVTPAAAGVAAVVAERTLPFHWLPKMVPVLPLTAVPSTAHTVVATHETESRPALVLPAGRTADTRVHAVPFQVSATGPWPVVPTARQNDGPTHDTEAKVSSVVAGAFALGTTLQAVPFHFSVSVPPPVPTFCPPTATQNEALVHEMLFS
jgi:hypothetical protein